MRKHPRLFVLLICAMLAGFVAVSPAAATGGVVRDDDNERDMSLDLDYTDDRAVKRLVLPAGITTGATAATLSVYGLADACGGPVGNAHRILVNGFAAVNYDPCAKWNTADYSWASFSIPMSLLRQGQVNTFAIVEIAGNWADRNVYLGIDRDRDVGRSDIVQASSYFNGNIDGELMWYLTVLPLPTATVLAEEGFENGSAVTFHGTGASRNCGRFDTGACAATIAPTGNGNYIRAERVFNQQFQGVTKLSFAFLGENLNGDVDSWAAVKLDHGAVTLDLTQFWSPNNRVGVASDGHGSHVSFTSWPTANVWHEAVLTFDPVAHTVSATVNGVTRSLGIPQAASKIEKIEFGGVRWSSFGSPMHYDSVKITTDKPPNALPSTTLDTPADGRVYYGDDTQMFIVRGDDADGDDYRARVVIRDAKTTTVVREIESPEPVTSGSLAFLFANPRLPTGRYTWTAYAVDEHDAAGGAATPARGFTVYNCTGDTDCDDVPNTYESPAKLGTDPRNRDTDGDGLLDSWEVPKDTPGRGIRVPGPNGTETVVDPDLVFGPYGSGTGCKPKLDGEDRYEQQYTCLNRPPRPLHKDMYVEIDFQDCRQGNCPDLAMPIAVPVPGSTGIGFQYETTTARFQLDTLHHAPSAAGLRDVIDMYADAEVTNPAGGDGITLNVLVDQAVAHQPNCISTDDANRRHFGTSWQQGQPDVMAAKRKAVRYVFSAHSVAESDDCSTPTLFELTDPLPDYDYSTFGEVRRGGDFAVLSIGPLWYCPSFASRSALVIGGFGDVGPCFRDEGFYDPGIFPAKIEGHSRTFENPIHMLLGEKEREAGRQLYARSLAHLLGHAIGLESDATVLNQPAPAGRLQPDKHTQLSALPPSSYVSWAGVRLAPDGPGQAYDPVLAPHYHAHEDAPNYDQLALDDPDRDGRRNSEDNCPTVWNEDQKNTDWAPFIFPGGIPLDFLGREVPDGDFQGDRCDPDIDGDGLKNGPGITDEQYRYASPLRAVLMADGETDEAGATAEAAPSATEPEYDPYPFDTDNDGDDNSADPDDDGDGVSDGDDNCRLVPNAGNADTDGDGGGDACDTDADGDGVALGMEWLMHSDPLSASSKPEYVGTGTCANGVDDDADGKKDAADSGCADADADGTADPDDTCPAVPDGSNVDNDGDGRGDACDTSVIYEGVSKSPVGPDDATVSVAFSGTLPGTYEVRLGGDDCQTGTLLASGSYAAPAPKLVALDTSALPDGVSSPRICLTAAGETKSVLAEVAKDTTAPAVTADLTAASDTGASSTDEVTNVAVPELAGPADPGTLVTLYEDGLLAAQVTADEDGRWSVSPPVSPAEGTHTYRVTAVDVAGNSAESAPLAVVFDRTAPATTSNAPPAETTEPVTFTFDADEPATFECSLDDAAWRSCASPYTASPPVGTHTLAVRATDVAGNVETGWPTHTWRVLYRFTGFFTPVDNAPTVNRVKAGAAVPVKFSLDGDQGLGVFASGSPASAEMGCDSGDAVDDVEETVAASTSGLRYDAAEDQYVYVWKTDPAWAGTCRTLRVRLDDGSVRSAYFLFR